MRVGGVCGRSTWEEFVGEVRGSRCGLGYVVESMWFGICGLAYVGGCGCGCGGGGGLSI